jgi:hypothetical protein
MPVDTLGAEVLRRLLAYWQEKRGGAAMPARADISPFDFTYALGDLVLVEVHREPLRFRYRLHGVNLVARDGYDMTGKWLQDHPEPGYRDRILQTWTSVVETGEPHSVVREILVDGRIRRYESLVLPLAADRHRVDMLLGAQIYLG